MSVIVLIAIVPQHVTDLEKRLVTLPQIRWLFFVALQQEAHAPLTPHAHWEREHGIAQLFFGTQLIVEPRLYNLPQQRTIR